MKKRQITNIFLRIESLIADKQAKKILASIKTSILFFSIFSLFLPSLTHIAFYIYSSLDLIITNCNNPLHLFCGLLPSFNNLHIFIIKEVYESQYIKFFYDTGDKNVTMYAMLLVLTVISLMDD